jgi:EmrB/QacA subfamily drug resistance transporter
MHTRSQAAVAIPAPETISTSYRAWAMVSIVLGGYINVLNSHVINVVIPKMMSALGTDIITIRWVVTSYMLANAVVIPITSWLARVLGARQAYIYALILFTSSAMICGMVQSVEVLIFFRILQGIGGGVIMPVTMLLMLDLYPLEKRGLGTAIWGMGASCGSLTGIPLGGILAEQLSWRAAFYANLPPGAIALLIAIFVMHPSPRERQVPFDWGGFITMSMALAALLVALSNGQREGWGSNSIVGLFAVSGVSLAAFLVLEPRVKTPMIDLHAFRSPSYVIAIVLSIIAGAMFSGGPFLLSLFLQRLYDLSVQQAAMIMFPSSAFLVLCTSFTGWASDHIDHRPLMMLGYVCYGTFGVLMLFADLRFTPLVLLVIYFGRGLGLGFTYSVLYPVGLSGFDPARAKAASTVLNLCITLGGAWAVAILAAIMDQRQQIRQAWLAETQQLTAVGTQQALQTLETAATQMGSAMPPELHAHMLLGRLIDHEALILAFNDASALFVVISLGGLVLVPFFRRARLTG